MNAIEKLNWLESKEFNISITSFACCGYTFKLGDEMNGYNWVGDDTDFESGVEKLYQAAVLDMKGALPDQIVPESTEIQCFACKSKNYISADIMTTVITARCVYCGHLIKQ